MPSPFPGMDPYLEGELWSPFHYELCLAVKHLLLPKLRPRYYPFTSKYFLPDLLEETEEIGNGEHAIYADVGVPWIDIREVKNRSLVTHVIFLSPGNKYGLARQEYLGNRTGILTSQVHLVELDLLRLGKRPPMREPYPVCDYYCLLSRAQRRPQTEVWPIRLTQPLPTIPVPLLPGDAEVVLDMQQAFAIAYDGGGFDAIIDYGKPPDVPLSEPVDAWADSLLRRVQLRK